MNANVIASETPHAVMHLSDEPIAQRPGVGGGCGAAIAAETWPAARIAVVPGHLFDEIDLALHVHPEGRDRD